MTLRIINDCHIGTVRTSGTTPNTQLELRQYIIDRFQALLPDDGDLMILGDLFDKENIPISDVLKTYEILLDWLFKGNNLYLVAGNHDLSKTSSILSSFDFLGGLLTKLFPAQVVVIKQAQMTPYGYVIPHVANQDLFNVELEKVPPCDYLFLHCNYDNGFASQLDQSLNLSQEQASTSPAKKIVIAHEHYHRESGKILLPGNQIPSSCADWASAQDKFYTDLLFTDGGSYKASLSPVLSRGDEYAELDWRELSVPTLDTYRFVKITGTASAEEASAVVTQISKARQAAKTLVITNGVTIESQDGVSEQFSQSLDGVKAFNVWEALKKILDRGEIETLEGIMHD